MKGRGPRLLERKKGGPSWGREEVTCFSPAQGETIARETTRLEGRKREGRLKADEKGTSECFGKLRPFERELTPLTLLEGSPHALEKIIQLSFSFRGGRAHRARRGDVQLNKENIAICAF